MADKTRVLGGLALLIGGIGAALGIGRRTADQAATLTPARADPFDLDAIRRAAPGSAPDPEPELQHQEPVAALAPAPPPAPAPAQPRDFASFKASAGAREVVARTAWGEARGEGRGGMAAVVHVIRNRADSGLSWLGGSDPRRVCLAPFQFSVWNHDDANRRATLAVTEADPHYRVALALYDRIILLRDDTDVPGAALTATHYFVSNTPRPGWAGKLPKTGQYKAHAFYREGRAVT